MAQFNQFIADLIQTMSITKYQHELLSNTILERETDGFLETTALSLEHYWIFSHKDFLSQFNDAQNVATSGKDCGYWDGSIVMAMFPSSSFFLY